MSENEKGPHGDNELEYSKDILALAKEPKHFGRMNDPTCAGFIKGPCGEELEFYLVIKNEIVDDVKFYTKGCISTTVCGSVTAEMVLGKSIEDALGISPKKVMEVLFGLPKEHCHCSILAVSTLYRAIADYLLKK